MRDKDIQKTNTLKRCIGKKYVILNHKNSPFLVEVLKIVDEYTLTVRGSDRTHLDASIFDLRNPNQEF